MSPDLLRSLVCPSCHGDLTYDAGAAHLTCSKCRLKFRVEDDIAKMLIDEAEKF